MVNKYLNRVPAVCVMCFLLASSVLCTNLLHARTLPNVLIMTLDTTRPDHLGCYGYNKDTTPNIDRLAGDGVLFSTAITVIPLTTPSHASIMTGLLPVTHQVHRNSMPVQNDFTMLAEILKREGYATGGFVSVKILESALGFSQGFDHFSDVPPASEAKKSSYSEVPSVPVDPTLILQRRGDETVDEALAWLDRNVEKPFFLWVHLYDPHLPYTPPREYGLRYNPEYEAYLDRVSSPFMKMLSYADQRDYVQNVGEPDDQQRTQEGFRAFFNLLGFMTSRVRMGENVPADLVDDMIAAYDGEVSFTDEQVGRVRTFLEERRVYENTYFIIMADHGEILHEKEDYFGHHKYLYQGSMKIPLIMGFPGAVPQRVDELVTIVDVAPTLLDGLGIDVELPMDGVSFWPRIAGEGRVREDEKLVLYTHTGEKSRAEKQRESKMPLLVQITSRAMKSAARLIRRLFMGVFRIQPRWSMEEHFDKIAVLDGGWKLIRNEHITGERGFRYELYNVREDPGELHDLIDTREDVAAGLKKILHDYIQIKRYRVAPEPQGQADEDVKTLRSLGYM
jgi:arylsulfatase A-like enzyme